MKISDVKYVTLEQLNQMDRFDLKSMPKKARWYLHVLSWILSIPETFIRRVKIEKINMKNLKGPYVLLCNHNSFFDFKVATRAIFPRRANYVVAIDGFINREWLLRSIGCIGKRKFISDPNIVKQLKHSLESNKSIAAIYPEARYSLIGTTAIIPESLGKLLKKFKYPVVTLISHGHHLHQPVWNLRKRKVKLKAVMTRILTSKELGELSLDEINSRIKNAFYYNDYEYQLDNKIAIKGNERAKNLHKVLYKCPHCMTDFSMRGVGNQLKCINCSHTYNVNEYNQLEELNHKTIFSSIPAWFEWQREEVRKEIESGVYNVEIEVDVDALPNSKGFYRLGKAILTHNENGFLLKGSFQEKLLEIHKPVLSNYSIHVEYDYFGKGDAISFSQFNDTYYLFPTDKNYSVTKFHFAVEELFKIYSQKK